MTDQHMKICSTLSVIREKRTKAAERDFLGSPVVKILYFQCRRHTQGLISGQVTKIPHVAHPKTFLTKK